MARQRTWFAAQKTQTWASKSRSWWLSWWLGITCAITYTPFLRNLALQTLLFSKFFRCWVICTTQPGLLTEISSRTTSWWTTNRYHKVGGLCLLNLSEKWRWPDTYEKGLAWNVWFQSTRKFLVTPNTRLKNQISSPLVSFCSCCYSNSTLLTQMVLKLPLKISCNIRINFGAILMLPQNSAIFSRAYLNKIITKELHYTK